MTQQPTALAGFTIFIDADACPGPVKELIFKTCIKQRIPTLLVANRLIHSPKIQWIKAVAVPAGPDEADAYIVAQVQPGDLVITADIPLAALALAKGAKVLDHRGKEFVEANIRERLALRDFSTSLRESGVQTAGPAAFGPKDREAFANGLNRCLTQLRTKHP